MRLLHTALPLGRAALRSRHNARSSITTNGHPSLLGGLSSPDAPLSGAAG